MLHFMIGADNELVSDLWLRKVLGEIPQRQRILDAGAGVKHVGVRI